MDKKSGLCEYYNFTSYYLCTRTLFFYSSTKYLKIESSVSYGELVNEVYSTTSQTKTITTSTSSSFSTSSITNTTTITATIITTTKPEVQASAPTESSEEEKEKSDSVLIMASIVVPLAFILIVVVIIIVMRRMQIKKENNKHRITAVENPMYDTSGINKRQQNDEEAVYDEIKDHAVYTGDDLYV
eukprot:m.36497 g.36497  ORF g.36497 m.36497 type:complete len:186 (-) comp9125_c1_seq2:77-634(-)